MKETGIVILLIIGLLFCATQKHSDIIEPFKGSSDCPNLLVQEGNKILLLNKNKAHIPGVNPIVFNNLEEYVEFVNWQRKMGIHCPVLYFQQTYDAQNKRRYRMLPDITEKNAGFPSHIMARERPLYDAAHDDPPFNVGSYSGFDAQDQNIGAYTPLDKLYHSSDKVSANPMDVNWGGRGYARDLVKAGVYQEDSRPGLPTDYSKSDHEAKYDLHKKYQRKHDGQGDEKYYHDKYHENKRDYEKNRKRYDERHRWHHEDHHRRHHEDHHRRHPKDHQHSSDTDVVLADGERLVLEGGKNE